MGFNTPGTLTPTPVSFSLEIGDIETKDNRKTKDHQTETRIQNPESRITESRQLCRKNGGEGAGQKS